jgi:hypothetical protein
VGVSASKPTQQRKGDAVLGHGSIGSPAGPSREEPIHKGSRVPAQSGLFSLLPSPVSTSSLRPRFFRLIQL